MQEIIDLFNSPISGEADIFLFYGYLFGYGGIILLILFFVNLIFTAGLSYVPYLYKTNQLHFGAIIKIGFKKIIPVGLAYICLSMTVGIVAGVFSVMPFISILTSLVSSYIVGIGIFVLDYHLSKNMLHGQKAHSYLDRNIATILKNKNSERGVYIVPIYYMLVSFVGLAGIFIRPLIQLKIIAILNDEEAFYQSPPPVPHYNYPPPPPQQIG